MLAKIISHILQVMHGEPYDKLTFNKDRVVLIMCYQKPASCSISVLTIGCNSDFDIGIFPMAIVPRTS